MQHQLDQHAAETVSHQDEILQWIGTALLLNSAPEQRKEFVEEEAGGVLEAAAPIPSENEPVEIIGLAPLSEPAVWREAQKIDRAVWDDNLVLVIAKSVAIPMHSKEKRAAQKCERRQPIIVVLEGLLCAVVPVGRLGTKQFSAHAAGKQKKGAPPGGQRPGLVALDKIRDIDFEVSELLALARCVVCGHDTATSCTGSGFEPPRRRFLLARLK